MPLTGTHEVYARRKRRNLVLGAVLGSFVILVFAITIVKMSSGHQMEAFDHSVRPSLLEAGQ